MVALTLIPSEILPRLFLSNYRTARDAEKLGALGITHVVSALDYTPVLPACIPPEQRLFIRVEDVPNADILKHLAQTTAFIDDALRADSSNRVLVHCFQGVSRSATIVCAYLVASTSMPADYAVKFVQTRRNIVCPNSGFRSQLKQYARRLGGPNVHRRLIKRRPTESL
ncbi:phosphatases II [Fistulina hepatica ATCC 64428]|uniref:protein-tyrosine-phosphatase n=1 Tax=Fistulina hepatica ATCC 64428 TaxID=1128425 RepID=A0A0D6ZZV7_9AGAR|nr:phosphatases II [Fistulina hepatica ATCC 64428]